jgi:hypothetical protein
MPRIAWRRHMDKNDVFAIKMDKNDVFAIKMDKNG